MAPATTGSRAAAAGTSWSAAMATTNCCGGNLGDLMVGGAGADRLVGGSGNDILIAGLLADGSNNEDDNYTTSLPSSMPGMIPPPLKALDDGAVDRLTGGGGYDTFYYNFAGGGVLDIVTDNAEGRFDI